MRRKLTLFLVFLTILFLSFNSVTMGIDKPGSKQKKSGIRSIYDPPDRVAPEHFGAVPTSLSQGVFYPFVGKILSPGDTVGYTYFDYQKNGSMGRQIAVDDYFAKHFIWMNLIGPADPGYDRYVDYNYQDSSGSWLGAMHITPDSARAGFTNIELLSDNREVLCYHQTNVVPSDPYETSCMLAIEESTPGAGSFNTFDIPDSLPGAVETDWPYVAMDSLDQIHVVMREYTSPGLIGYTRCYEDSDSIKCEAPGVAEVNIPPNETQPSSNMVSVVDIIGTISHIIVSSPVSNKVAIVYTKYRNPEFFETDNDVYYIESTNGGQDWIDAGSFSGITKHNITNYTSSNLERAYYDVSAVYDYDDSLHICWNPHWFDESTGQYSTRYTGLDHWSKATGIRTIAIGYWGGTNPGAQNRNLCKMSISAKQSNGNLYVIWTQFNAGDTSAAGYSNGEIYTSASTDGGLSWAVPVNLTNTSSPGCSPGDCESDHWSTLAKEIDDSLHIFYVNDRDAGGIPWLEEGSYTQNPMLYMKYPAWDPLPHPRIAVDHQIFEDIDVPNNSFRDTSFGVENIGNAQLDVTVSSFASWIDITSDTSFSIFAGGNPVDVSIKFDASPYSEVVLHDSIIVTSNDSAGNQRIVIPVRGIVVTDEDYYHRELAYVANSTMSILESNLGSIAEEVPEGGMYTFMDERYYLYDGSVFLATINSNGDTLISRDIFGNEFTHAASNLVVDTLDQGDHVVLRSRAKFYPFFPDIGTLWPGWWWDVEMSMENLMFEGENPPVPENVMISSIDFYPKSAPAWWPSETPPTPGDLYLGMALDWDVPTDEEIAKNNGGYEDSYYLMWQNGIGDMTNYHAGLSYLENSPPYGANIIDNPTYLWPNYGFLDGELYQIASTPGDSVYGENIDLTTVMTAKHLVSLTDTVTVKFALAVTSEGIIDLKNAINKARVFSGVLSGALAGDVDNNGIVDVGDVAYLFYYLFEEGPVPVLWGSGDVDEVAGVNIGDIVYLDDYLFVSGPVPQRPPFPEVPPETLMTDTLAVILDSNPEVGKYIYNLELVNSDTVWSLAIPLTYGIAGGTITCDSVSFVSTRVADFSLKNCLVDHEGQRLLIGLLQIPSLGQYGLPAGSGPVAKLYFTISDPSWDWSFSFNTTFFEPSNKLLLAQGGWPRNLVVPQFEAPYLLQPPIPDFVGSPVIGEKDLEVTFIDSSEGIIDSWYWSFGDGYTSIESDPVHTYKAAGTYNVKLIVTNQFGSDSLIKENYIQVLDKPLADFTADLTAGSPPLGVQFIDNSIGNVTSWKWYFGDDDSSFEEDPYHEYTSLGTYDVTLIATSINGLDSVTKKNFIYTYPALSGDSVRVLDVTAVPNQEDVTVRIIMSNYSDSLAGITVPLIFDNPSSIQIDSVSFDWSRAAHFPDKGYSLEAETLFVWALTWMGPYLPVGQGLFATIYLKVEDVIPPVTVTFDSTSVEPDNKVLYATWDAGTITPGFYAGSLFVEKADTIPPEQPQNLVALPLESGVSLTWDAVTDPDLRLYAVYKDYNRDSLDDTLATTDDPFYLDLTVSPGETLFYSVSAVDSSWNESEYSDYAHVIFGDTSAPVITVGPTVIAISDTMATIYWETDEEADGYGEIYIDTNWVTADSHTTFLLEHTATVTWLEPSTSYPFRVHSTDSLDNGPTYSDSGFLTTTSGPDETPPQIIFGPAVVYLTHNSATIEWTTDEIADGVVWYGQEMPFPNFVFDTSFVTEHSITLYFLSPEEFYGYNVNSADLSGNGPTTSENLYFTTEAAPDTLPPVIVEGPSHAGITHNKAVINWVTDEIATSIVQYGPSELYGSERTISAFVQNHQIVLTRLQDTTLYHYRVGSIDPESNGPTWSSNFWFWTHAAPHAVPPIILTGPYVSWLNDTQAQIDWTTDEVSDSWVYYRLEGSVEYGQAGSPRYVKVHSVVLTNLVPDTTYDFYISSTDPQGNTVESEHTGGGGMQPLDTGDDQFTTRASPDVTAPVIISGPHVRHKTHEMALVEWTTDETGNSIVEYGLSQDYGTLITYPEATINHTAYLSNLSPNTTYHFRVGSQDIANNGPTYSSDVTFTTSADVCDTEPPVITVAPGIAYADESRAIITWETDEPADSYMGYELMGGRAEKVVGESFCMLSHRTTLNMQSSYNVRVFSSDQYGNGPTYSDYFTVTALATPDVSVPAIVSGPEVVYVSENSAKISWETDELSSSFVEYGLSVQYTDVEANPENDSLHEVILTNLASSTTYHYRIKSADLFGNTYLGSDETFGTASSSDVTPPSTPTGLSATYGNGWIKPSWDKNPEADLSGYNLHRGTALSDTTLPLIASNLPDTAYRDQGLTNGVTYYYQVAAADRNSNESPPSEIVCSKPLSYVVGDFNGDEEIGLVDVVSIINYVFKGAEGHEPLEAGNVNCNEGITITDIVYLINYLFKGGEEPCICTMPLLLARYQTKAKAVLGLNFPSGDKPGIIEVLLEAELEEEVAGIELDLSFDHSKLEVDAINTTSRTEKLDLFYNIRSGSVKIGLVDIYGANTLSPGQGPLLEIKLRQRVSAISGLKIDKAIVANTSAQELEVQIQPNKVLRSIPGNFSLAQNYPNPFNARTIISYSLPEDSKVEITIYNILGQRVKTLMNEYQLAGYKRVIWDGTNQKGKTVASGIYFYSIKAGDFTSSKKMLLLK